MTFRHSRQGTRRVRLTLVAALLVMLGVTWPNHGQVARAATTSYAQNQVTVTLAPGTSIAAFNAAHGTTTAQALPDGQTFVVDLPATETVNTAVTDLTGDPTVTTAEPNYTVDLMAAEQFYLSFDQIYIDFQGTTWPSKAQGQWALSKIDAPSAQTETSGSGVTVAVLDTGVDPTHPVLAPHLVQGGYDYISQTATMSDVVGGPASGHGTFVAGLIAQVAPNARILPFRVLDSNGQGTVANVANAIEAAVNDGAQVINLSMGMAISSNVLHEAITYAQDHGVIVVASTGNQDSTTPQYPAAWDGVVSVAGTDQNDRHASFSNYGTWVSVSAPGVNLYSTYPGGYAYGSGTSFAAPLVAGEAALLWAATPSLDAEHVTGAIEQGSVDINSNNPGYQDMLGNGRIDAATALTVNS